MVSTTPERPPDTVLSGPAGVGPPVSGPALVSQHGFSARYDLDRENGLFSRQAHDLHGQSFLHRILVFPTAKGGIATSWMLHEMTSRDKAPLGLVFGATNPVMVQGAVLAEMPLMHRLDPPPHRAIETGDWLEMDPAAGAIKVWHASIT